ncbi:MAG: membrane protein insertion efficiency factor YidD [Candidatus Levybacteria bacterium RIFCSPLOWO2_02_FULL_37_10]|nr:MAG: membrane protein insertion efficiency factor YidD [Candidatus Levybacteria bacterium RIFCSPHIGHO2_01_FULL_37_33]OGH16664.1 MAG: membrane protein insertion efficiency factor YidD [Candidatus Levybacteria bacterium RIFCSPHIGHO2_02_FULL_37_11]OGH29356.1 MAG: membrane protein insertion efficiency factor YidD [Candidatus Levybacteria bacterium RIFCSPHIGHO2_12_FULL_37_12]OGH32490.1 MAG: membrane protein insertion efficiency factor YidD [Candidatus Levybacteria bacterium RIFCSPLOWO2_01_FULL_36_
MKYLLLVLIITYQKILSPVIKNTLGVSGSCRFYPTCSQYAYLIIEKEGVLKGSYLSFRRLIKCQPFYKENYDRSISL